MHEADSPDSLDRIVYVRTTRQKIESLGGRARDPGIENLENSDRAVSARSTLAYYELQEVTGGWRFQFLGVRQPTSTAPSQSVLRKLIGSVARAVRRGPADK